MLNEVMGYIQDIWARLSRLESKNVQLLQVRASTTASKNTNVNNGAGVAIDWNLGATALIGNNGTLFTHSTSTNPTRITINRKALIEVVASVMVTGSVTDANIEGRIRTNAGTYHRPYGYAYISNTGGHNIASLQIFWQFKAAAGDYFEVYCFQEAAAGTVTLYSDLTCVNAREIFQ